MSVRTERRLTLADGANVVDADGEVRCFVGDGAFALDGASPALVARALELSNGQRSFDEVLAALSPEFGGEVARAVLLALEQSGVLTPAVERQECRVAVGILGNDRLLDALDRALAEANYMRRTRIHLKSIDCGPNAPKRLGTVGETALLDCDRLIERADFEALRALLSEFELVICGLEGVPYAELLEVNRAALAAGVPCLFVTPDVVGPYVTPGAGACLGCSLLEHVGALELARTRLSPRLEASAWTRALAVASAAVEELRSPGRGAEVLRLNSGGVAQRVPLLAQGACPFCRESGNAPLSRSIAEAVEIGRLWPISPYAAAPSAEDGYRHVGIVGGGTAGFLTALILRKLRPELKVTLIESSAIPVIGVGEATTPELVKFLHSPRFLDRDILDFWRRVRPTWKLGINFEWGPRDFTFPFQRGRLLESRLYEGHIDCQSLGALLMRSDKGPVFRDENGETTSLAHLVRWAYHLENRRFVRYLHEEAIAAGVEIIDAKLTDVERSPDGREVAALRSDDGRRFEFDLYVDCSGFRSLLLERTLGSRFTDWSSTLFNDHAVTGVVPHDGRVKPYTVAETMNAGWCWNIPFADENHRGYVFSSRFLSPDQAEAEMRAKNPGMHGPGLVRFRSGRHEDFWQGNVVAIGNSYAFVEPLESTAIHMIVLTLELLTSHFPSSKRDTAVRAQLNRKVAARWDALRWFLGIHFRFNRRLDTPYWRAANTESDISGAAERVALFRERAPLSYRSSLFYTVHPPEYFSDDHSFDTLLTGQDVEARYLPPIEDRRTWDRRMATLKRLDQAALPHARALEWLIEERPDELQKLKSSPDSWLYSWVPA